MGKNKQLLCMCNYSVSPQFVQGHDSYQCFGKLKGKQITWMKLSIKENNQQKKKVTCVFKCPIIKPLLWSENFPTCYPDFALVQLTNCPVEKYTHYTNDISNQHK